MSYEVSISNGCKSPQRQLLSFCLCAPSFREDEDASHCAVPISTSLIKQIMNKTGNEDNVEHVLADFYGPKTSSEPPWPYATKDTTR